MTVEEGVTEMEKKKIVLVGIRFDANGRELLNWAIVKVAEPGDHVVAVHVCQNSSEDPSSKEDPSLDGYLEVYKGLCNIKQVDLTGQISRGSSVRNVLVKEAKLCEAMTVIVGISKINALGGCVSVAKYCAKRLPPTTTVLAIHNGKVVFKRGSINQPPGDPTRSLYSIQVSSLKENQPSFRVSETSDVENFSPKVVQNLEDGSRDGGDDTKHDKFSFVHEYRDEVSSSSISGGDDTKHDNFSLGHEYMDKVSSSSISVLTKELQEPRPGWPLLRRAASATPEILKESEARKMSVVQWVMTLPNRTPPPTPQTQISLDKTEISFEREHGNYLSLWGELPKELELLLRTNSSCCRRFSHKEIKRSTSQFSSENLIGKGGCSRVYKGYLPDGEPVAVKILKPSKEAWKDFVLEVNITLALKHKHITPLIGVCIEDSDLISVYDFLSKGSLEENLHGNIEKSVLSWEVRFKVAVGVAEAINYLHKECSQPVIHRDVKSSNILLSDDFEPQLTDFGLAIWAPTSSSYEIHSDVVGTFGYLAPEYFMYGKVSNKTDVYSFGVVLLELLSGRKPIGTETPKGQESLVMWAKPILESGDMMAILDPNLAGNFDKVQMRRMVLAASLCITRTARLRPQMSEILKLLRGEKDVEEWVNTHFNDPKECDNQDDDEAYPDSSVESHLGLALLDVDDDTTSLSSVEQNHHHTLEDYFKGRWSRSSSFD